MKAQKAGWRGATRWELLLRRGTRCQVCKEILFFGADPLDVYVSGGGGWPGGVVGGVAVCQGSWRNLWRRKWYHQKCCGVYFDCANLAGHWVIFGGTGPQAAARELLEQNGYKVMRPEDDEI
jgi:hypothetical protein